MLNKHNGLMILDGGGRMMNKLIESPIHKRTIYYGRKTKKFWASTGRKLNAEAGLTRKTIVLVKQTRRILFNPPTGSYLFISNEE